MTVKFASVSPLRFRRFFSLFFFAVHVHRNVPAVFRLAHTRVFLVAYSGAAHPTVRIRVGRVRWRARATDVFRHQGRQAAADILVFAQPRADVVPNWHYDHGYGRPGEQSVDRGGRSVERWQLHVRGPERRGNGLSFSVLGSERYPQPDTPALIAFLPPHAIPFFVLQQNNRIYAHSPCRLLFVRT